MLPTPADPPALAALNRWLARHPGRTHATYWAAYRRVLPALQAGPLTPERARDIVEDLARRYRPATVRVTVAALRTLWAQFEVEGLVRDNPWACTPTPTPPQTRGRRLLTEEEVHRLLRAPAAARDRALLTWLYYTGLRVREATSVRWADLREDRGRWFLTVYGKGAKTRTILVPGAVVRLAEQVAGPVRPPEARIWPLHPRTVQKIVTQAAARAGIGKAVSPHWLRHAYATHAIAHGAPLHVVQASLGHSRLDTTAVYLEVAPGESAGTYLPPLEADPGGP